MALPMVEAFFRFPPAHHCLLAGVRWPGGFAFTQPRFAPWPGNLAAWWLPIWPKVRAVACPVRCLLLALGTCGQMRK